MVKALLLYCGVLASILYVAADIGVSLSDPGYSYLHQTISELSAIGSDTRSLALAPFFLHAVLQFAFGLGVWLAASTQPALRVPAGAFTMLGILDMMAPWAAMHVRGAEPTASDAMHILLTMASVLMIVTAMVSTRQVAGRGFRLYTDLSLALVLVAGAATGFQSPGIPVNLPTPWLGVIERSCIYAFMFWMAMLATILLGTPAPTPRAARVSSTWREAA
jgi:hypothetical protein